jgi:hypothetical protein
MKNKKMELPTIFFSPTSTKEWQKPLFYQLKSQLKDCKAWREIFSNTACFIENNLHLAIFVEPYLDLVLTGKKTIESRFSINRCPPFQKTLKNDIVLLKKSGGPIVGICQIEHVWSYTLNTQLWGEIRSLHSKALCIEDENFWKQKEKAKFATLLKVINVTTLNIPIMLTKSDRRGWVVLYNHEKEQEKLF